MFSTTVRKYYVNRLFFHYNNEKNWELLTMNFLRGYFIFLVLYLLKKSNKISEHILFVSNKNNVH